MKLKIQVVRHGQTTANAAEIITGVTDVLLTDEGKQQLQLLAQDKKTYAATDGYFTSGLTRTEQTLKILYGDVPFTVIKELQEIDFGRYEEQPFSAVDEFYGYFFANDFAHLGGNTYQSYREQIKAGLNKLVDYCVAHQYQSATCVGHQGTMRMLAHLLLNTPIDQYRQVNVKNGKGIVFILEIDQKGYRVLDFKWIG